MNLGIIQARMSSTRLPGKMMLPLAGDHVITHIVNRVAEAATIDDLVVATSDRTSDDILERYATRAGASVYRGDVEDVLGRMYGAAVERDPDVVVRVAGDRPLLPPECIDAVVRAVREPDVDYASNVLERSFPRGFEAEAFTFESFREVERLSTEPYQREHVTPYYRSGPEEFTCVNVDSTQVFDDPSFQDRVDLRLTLDESDDYEMIRTVYENVSFEGVLPARSAIRYVDEHGLSEMNAHVSQKSFAPPSGGSEPSDG